MITDFDYVVDENANILKYIARRKAVPKEVVKKIEDLYTKLLQIEQVRGIDGSEKFLTGYLEELGMTYVQLITKIMVDEANEEEEKQELEVAKTNDDLEHVRSGFFSKFFATKLNLF
ncbi:hypothetical protein [Flavobacterium oreochromis]|uniref:hypothetical protein n=1 Tax=Flavobacterium oreochromis TaxID=2906078 RepID=UPI00216406D5|nr:hypothetical protein [Flavobacterium oreochromis]